MQDLSSKTIEAMKKTCPICGTRYIPKKSNQKYCSPKCAKESLKSVYRQNKGKTYKDYLEESKQQKNISQHLKDRKEGKEYNFVRIGNC